MARLRYEAQRRLSRRQGSSRTLESQLNPEAELELSQQRRASLVPAETLYTTHWSEPKHRVYQHYSETRVLVTEGQQNLSLINTESYGILRREGMQLIHLRLVMIRIHARHRRNAGTNALIVLRDTRWNDDRSIIGTMEVDLSEGTQLVYIAPNLLISVEDFYHHIEIAIQTHGASNTKNNCGASRNEMDTTITKYTPDTKSASGNPRPSNYNERDTEDIHEEEFAGVFFQEFGMPDTNDRWNTLGEPTGRYNFYVNYAAPPPVHFIPPTKPCWDDDDDYDDNDDEAKTKEEVVCPSIWEDTPWEDDPEFDPNELAEEEDDPKSYYLELQNQELDYPVLAPIPEETAIFPQDQVSQEEGSEQYWQQVVQHIEQIEGQLPMQNGWHNPIPLDYSFEDFIDRIPEGIPPGVWYEIYENPEQAEYEVYDVPEGIHNETIGESPSLNF
ncbi:hypothetical protein ZIOFF_044546 [Zingiber officinale]|uniref:Uncharacterized protein n=1 Tax=Zingiber officinale TaxID=94328 RepID=A0A8J5L0C4_ZINOF|nr:hypothetical protein ZIOFF_044546 [Zingiber officinale]